MSELRAALAALIGQEHVADDPASLEEYARDESFVAGMGPWAVARPGSHDEVAALVAWARDGGTPLVPVSSSGPHFHGDTVPTTPGAVIVDLRRLDRILRIDRRNRMAVVEPGVTFPRLQAALAEQGMRLTPPLAPRAGKSVVAALLERQPTLIPRYNFHLPEPLRDCGVVWGDGQSMYTGEAGAGPLDLERQWQGGLVQADPKGPAQTDFFRLLTGAQGSMGIVTWASVRCEIAAAAHRYLFAAADRLEDLVDLTYRVNRIRLGDEVLIVNDAYLARLLAALQAERTGDEALGGAQAAAARRAALPPFALILGLGGREHYAAERVAVQEKDARALAERCGLKLTASLPGAAVSEIEAALAGCCGRPWKLAARGGSADIFFLTTLDRAAGYVAAAHEVAAAHRYPLAEIGLYVQPQHQGVSHHVELSLPYDPADPAAARQAEAVFAAAGERLIGEGAYFSRPYGPWAQPVYNRDAAARDALRKVKAIFDPAGIMNPGKLCFGGPTTEAGARAGTAPSAPPGVAAGGPAIATAKEA